VFQLVSNSSTPLGRVCTSGRFSCRSYIHTDTRGHARAAAAPQGFAPSDLAKAYNVDTTVDPAATVAVVDAFGYPNAESDLAAYRSQFNLPPCTQANGCLTIVNQQGQSGPLPVPPPAFDDWTVETALDLDMVSAACPNCKILLVQADDDQGDGLQLAQAIAARFGVVAISNSWDLEESRQQPVTGFEHFYDVGTVGIFVATGDNGFDDGRGTPGYPSTSAFSIAVGGTTLRASATSARGFIETAWSLSRRQQGAGGSGCSFSIPKPKFQPANTACSFRATSDISAVADPQTGLAVFNADQGGFIVVGGTSAATPYTAGLFASVNHGSEKASFVYANPKVWNDVTTGTNGNCGNILCKAGKGWDGPTGLGTPNGRALAAIR
jgi:subtilase family serine protease